MKKSNKNPKNLYRLKLLQEFDRLKSEEALQEVLEYTKFIRGEEKSLEKLKSPESSRCEKKNSRSESL